MGERDATKGTLADAQVAVLERAEPLTTANESIKDLQLKLRELRETYRERKQGCVAWEEHRAVVRVRRDRIGKARAQTELNVARDVKGNQKGFYVQGRRREETGRGRAFPL